MKKLLFLLAVAGLISFAACKSGETKAEASADSAAQVEVAIDSAVAAAADTTVAQ